MNDRKKAEREVTEASEDSFPASDPPAFTGTRTGTPDRGERDAGETRAAAGDAGEASRGRSRPALWVVLLLVAAAVVWWAAS